MDEHDVAPGAHAALPPLPERVLQHALDLLEGVRRRRAATARCRTPGARSRSARMTALRRRGPAPGAALHRARRRQPRRPHRRRGHPAASPSRPARRSRVAIDFVSRLPRVAVPDRLQGRLLHGRAVVPEDRRPAGDGLELPPVPRRERVLLRLRRLRRLDRRARRATRGRSAPRDCGSTSARPRRAASSTASSRRASTTSRGRRTRATSWSIRTRSARPGSATCELILLLQPEHRRQAERHFTAAKAALSGYGRVLGPYPYPTLTIVDPPWGARGAGGMEYPTLITAGTSLERARARPAARGRHGPRDRPPVLLRPARDQRVRGGVAGRGLQHLHDGPGPPGGLRERPRRAPVFGLNFPLGIDIRHPVDTNRRYFETADWDVLATESWKFRDRRSYGATSTRRRR